MKRSRTNVSKNHVVWARCHLTGLASGIDCNAQSSADSGAASCTVAARTASRRSPNAVVCAPAAPPIRRGVRVREVDMFLLGEYPLWRNGHPATGSSRKQVILAAGVAHNSRINPHALGTLKSVRHARRQPVPRWRGLTPMSVGYSIVERRLSVAKTDGFGSTADQAPRLSAFTRRSDTRNR